MTEESDIRHSKADAVELVSDGESKARLEAANALRQAARVRDYTIAVLDGKPFKLRPSTLLDLNRCAIEGLDLFAGVWRPAGIAIRKSTHQPPGGHQVPEYVEEMCDYVNDNWSQRSAIHLSSFVMWRLNWIHPFTEGNGRTSRATSYLVLSAHSEAILPGAMSIPVQIIANRKPYYEALEKADKCYELNKDFPDEIVESMEELMATMLARQLKSAFDVANNLNTL